MTDPFLGEIKMTAFEFAPTGWAKCDGSILQASQNQALFSLLGGNFGGDGRTTFALPDMRGRTPLTLGNQNVGAQSGVESVTLTTSQMPTHLHAVQVTSQAADRPSVGVDGTALYATGNYGYGYTTSQTLTAMNPMMVGTIGNNAAHNNIQPSLVLGFCIAITGTYPQRP